MLIGVVIAICCKNHTKPMNTLRVLTLNGTAGPLRVNILQNL
jgi:hypothetical protein